MCAILVSADWHLNDNPRDSYRHEWQKQLRDLIADHNVHTLVFLGDLTDEKDNHSAALVNGIVNHLTKLHEVLATCPVCGGGGFSSPGTGYGDVCSECGGQRKNKRPQIFIMKGNHDYVNPECPFFKFTSALPDVTWINTPCIRKIDGTRFLFLPHTHNYQVDWAEIDFAKADMILAHNTFAGTVSESGQQLGGIPTTIFPKDVPVISGDIHMPQDVGCVTYVGSPYTVDFGDSFKPRVLLLDSDGTTKSIPCTGPQKRLVVATDAGNAISKLNAVKGDIVKLRVALNPADKDQWPTIKRELFERATEMGVRLHAIEAIVDKPTAGKHYKVSSSKVRRDDEVLKAYCTSRSISKECQYTAIEIVKEG